MKIKDWQNQGRVFLEMKKKKNERQLKEEKKQELIGKQKKIMCERTKENRKEIKMKKE